MAIELKIIILLFWHWMIDFGIQSKKQKQNKSSDIWYLLQHAVEYAFLIGICTSVMFSIKIGIIFYFSQFILHGLTDFITSKYTKQLWKSEKLNSFFILIGFDQWIHQATLIGTIYLLNN